MTICLIGKNLTTLMLTKIFINEGLRVDLYDFNNKKHKKLSNTISRTIGLSNDSINFLESQKILYKKNCWDIKQINLYKGASLKSFLNFKSEKRCFFMTSYNNFYKSLDDKVKKSKLFKIKKKNQRISFSNIAKKNYELIITADTNNLFFKKYFSKQIKKNYKSQAITTTISHQNLKNNIAEQYFTEFGPLAFLPISSTQTSIVFSVFDKDLIKDKDKIIKLIERYNRLYDIKNIDILKKFPINLSLSRNYFYKNILLFGDALHKIHPLAGQGFNMTLRDAKILSDLIKKNLDLGLSLNTVLKKFEAKRKNSNYIFAMGIDFIHEFFKLINKYDMKSVDHFFKFINKNLFIKNKIENFANKGFIL